MKLIEINPAPRPDSPLDRLPDCPPDFTTEVEEAWRRQTYHFNDGPPPDLTAEQMAELFPEEQSPYRIEIPALEVLGEPKWKSLMARIRIPLVHRAYLLELRVCRDVDDFDE